MAAPLVELAQVVLRYGAAGDPQGLEVLRGVDLQVVPGESVAILGPSGCGKSTLLHVLGALLTPTSGTVRFEGEDLGAKSADELARLRNRAIGFVFQMHHLLPQLTALENVLVPTLVARQDRVARAEAEARARALLAEVGLGARADHPPARLSGGECQRVAVVRALINRPRLVLADEPTGSLDAGAADRLAELLCGLNERMAVALVTVTHAPRLAARMQRALALRDGVLVAAGVPA